MSYNLLKGKRGIIFGALNDQSIAWKVAEGCRRRRCNYYIIKYSDGYPYGRSRRFGPEIKLPGYSGRCHQRRRFAKCIQDLHGYTGWTN